jgi:hypothetical protein
MIGGVRLAGKTFTEYKEIILYRLIEDENLLKALTINDEDFINKSLLIDPSDIPYKYIYPYKISSNILDTAKSIITIKFANFESLGVNYKSGRIYFYIICHTSLIRTSYGNRYDYIFERIKAIFNNSREFGIGKTILESVGDLEVNENYYGCVCCFEVTDFS